MLRPLLPLAILALGTSGALVSAADPAPRRDLPMIDNIQWAYQPGQQAQLLLRRKGMSSTFDRDDLPEIMDALAAAPRTSGEPVAFTLAREAGALACVGKADGDGAEGTCRFDPDEGFVAALEGLGLQAEDDEDHELLALAVVDARVASVEALSRAGYHFNDLSDVIEVAALEVTPEFADELREAGLVIEDLEELVEARAVELDAAWLREMAEAGFANLTVEKAIEMRALDVTPDYARRMRNVLTALGETE